ncbi:MAG: metallophosphoesterase [Candidatus Brocadiia bacterium]
MNGDPERILVTADLHFGLYTAGDECNLKLAEFVRHSDADVFALCGDVADADTDCFKACLDLFASFRGLKLLVPGNHDLWTAGSDSAEKYRKVLPALAADCGFSMLDTGPEVAGRFGFIGNIGWYDYSFRNKQLNVPLHQYEDKELPGVCVWNDSRFIDWDMTDREFTDKCVRKLLSAYRAVEERVHTVIALLHHVPFEELLYDHSNAAFEFCRAYMGSERFGRLLLDCPKVRYVFCGHRHGPDETQINGTRAFTIGSEYQMKRLIDLDLTTGEHTVHLFRPDDETPEGNG